MADFAGGFYYDLAVKTNLDKVNKGVGTFAKGTAAAGAGVAGLVTGAKAFANQFREINAIAKQTGTSAKFVRQIGLEFRQLGYEADAGNALVSNLGERLKTFQARGTGASPFGRLDIDMTAVKNVNDLITKLRAKVGHKDFSTSATELGLGLAQTDYLRRPETEFQANRQIAIKGSADIKNLINQEKKLSADLGKLSIAMDKLGAALLDLAVKVTPLINKLADWLGEDKSEDVKAAGDIAKGALAGASLGAFIPGAGPVVGAGIGGGAVVLSEASKELQKKSKEDIALGAATGLVPGGAFAKFGAGLVKSITNNITNNVMVNSTDEGKEFLVVNNELEK